MTIEYHKKKLGYRKPAIPSITLLNILFELSKFLEPYFRGLSKVFSHRQILGEELLSFRIN